MGLFGDKKKGTDSLKTLSEKDIQSRLYGHLRNKERIVQEDFPILSKPRQEPQSFQKSAEPIKTLTPSAAAPAKPSSSDLFTEVPQATVRIEEGASHKNYDMKPVIPAKVYTDKHAKLSVPPSQGGVVPFFHRAAGGVLQVVKQVAFKVLEGFAAVISAFIGLVFLFDFRKPGVRRFLYAAFLSCSLLLIFFGIHHLNKNREIAMKSPSKKASSQSQSSKQSHPSEPLQSALISDTAKETLPRKPAKNTGSAAVKVIPPASAPALDSAAAKSAKPSVDTPSPQIKKDRAAAAAPQEISGAVIQIATFATPEDAGKLVEKFKSTGFNSFYKSVSRSSGRVYYCVYLGSFQSQRDAEAELAKFKKTEAAKPFQDAFVRTL